eukprot:4604735-Karenia_brevis.AAC.1
MPRQLIGMARETADGRQLCFKWNIDGCDKAAAGQRCPKGWHFCCRPGCFKEHSLKDNACA